MSVHRIEPAVDLPTQDRGVGAALRRLRWRARRGLLENDLLIGRFLDQHGAQLDAEDAEALSRLLDLSDNALLDLLLERGELSGDLDAPAIRDVLARLRSVRLQPASGPALGDRSAPSTTSRPAGA